MFSLLSIQERTIETNVRNLMLKVGCNSRQSIREIMERSDKASLLHRHYYFLLIHAAFAKKLQAIAALIGKRGPACILVERSDKENGRLELAKHLNQAGVHLKRRQEKASKRAVCPIETADYILYVLPESASSSLDELQAAEESDILNPRPEITQAGTPIFLLTKEHSLAQGFTQGQEWLGYYYGVFDLLQKMMPLLKFEAIIEDFKHSIANAETRAMGGDRNGISEGLKVFSAKEAHSKSEHYIFTSRRVRLFLAGALSLSLIAAVSWGLSGNRRFTLAQTLISSSSIQSDLFIPPDPIFLERPQLMAQMKQKLKSQCTIQTLAVVGIGGAGKTTLVRHYASLQKANVIWELNAESQRSLARSFERLAYALSQSKEEKKTLTRLQEIQNPEVRDEKIFLFVRERLKAAPKWILIYDNVEDFKCIQPYFPTTAAMWGQGSVIVTTQDNTMKDNVHIKDVLAIDELTPQEQQKLFITIMNKAEEYPLTPLQREKAKQFLTEIPPFPLDTVMSAYYLKATGIPYTEYLERLKEYRAEFDRLQGSILSNASDYAKTRYGIITLSLSQLININKDFGELFVFLSLLDSQDIPRELLVSYKEGVIVDSFIYSLKKFSFIEDKSLPSFQPIPSFSMHRSLQELGLAYLVKAFNLKKNHPLLASIAKVFESYIESVTAKEDVIRIRLLASHCEAFLSHSNLLTDAIIGAIEGDLGVIYYYLGDSPRARQKFEDALRAINKGENKDLSKVAYILAHTGNTYMLLSKFEKARQMTEHSLALYKKHFPDNHIMIALYLRWCLRESHRVT
jgi:hypothetical protein